jgi:signal transduction histidine kinase
MTRDCHELTAVLVHVMLDRARQFRSSELLDEKMLSLGRLAAGLAHELNNPASAVTRSAKTLVDHLPELDAALRTFCGANVSDAQWEAVITLRDTVLVMRAHGDASPIERADRSDTIAGWLEDHDIDDDDADTLAESTMTLAELDSLAGVLPRNTLAMAVRYLTADFTVRRVAHEIETAASRIYTLVAAVKGFTYMDQSAAPKPVDIGQGLSDTLTVLRSKARAKSVDLHLDLESPLPTIDGYGGELNQVWANLVENAIDAVPHGGRVVVTAGRKDRALVVRVADNGPGIAEEIRGRIFDPFFTTKPVGQGTGLGLDIVRRLVHRHNGEIDLSTGVSGTEFRVTLPISHGIEGRVE